MRQAMQQHNALSAGRARQYAQVQEAVERDWSQRGIAGTSQMEMSPNAQVESELRALNVLVKLVGIAAAAAVTTWLAMGGMDLIRGLLA